MKIVARVVALYVAISAVAVAQAAELRIAIQQAQAGDARKYQGLLDYLAKKGLDARFVTVPDYQSAGDLFVSGAADAMFGGSGIASAMMIKGIARPLVRPIPVEGSNTYAAVVVAPRGASRFDGTAAWFAGKRVIFAPLASAGEFYFRSLGPSRAAAVLRAASHGAALDALGRGQADAAVIKNHVWTQEQGRYPALALAGGDNGQNVDGGLIVAVRLGADQAKRLEGALLAIEADGSPEAVAARKALKLKRYVAASDKDYEHTIAMLRRAGVTKDFAFKF